jgi:hypothetical protein
MLTIEGSRHHHSHRKYSACLFGGVRGLGLGVVEFNSFVGVCLFPTLLVEGDNKNKVDKHKGKKIQQHHVKAFVYL